MARNVAFFPVPPERIFAVLAQPESYAHWVVGSDAIRDYDPEWPAAGAKFHHRVGVGPLKINDNTEVLEVAPPHRLVLQARARPLGTARICLELTEEVGGTHVTMTEEPGDPLTRLAHNRVVDRLVAKRNHESLRRLGELAGAGSPPPDQPEP